MEPSDRPLTSKVNWSTPKTLCQPLAAVTPTVALSSGPLSPTESEDEPENASRKFSDDTKDVEIVKLRCQMEQLTQMVETVQSRLSGEETLGKEADAPIVAQLKKENEELHETLAIADKRLTEYQINIERMKEMFMEESRKMKQDLENLEEIVEKENRQKNEISRRNERLLKAKEGMERYVNTLPPQEEFEKIKKELELKSLAYQRLEERFVIQGETLKILQEKQTADSIQNERLKEDIVNMKQALVEVESINQAHSDRLKKSKTSKEGDLEVALEERDEAFVENKKLKQYAKFLQQKLKKTEEDLLKKLSERERLCEDLNENLRSKSEQLNVEKDTNRLLREQVSESVAKLSEKSRTVEIYEQELQCSKNALQIENDAQKLNSRIHKKLQKCVKDLVSLSRISSELFKGKSPDMPALLGIESREEGSATDGETLGAEAHLKELEKMHQSLSQCQEDIGRIRQILTDRYAEIVADSVTENCYVQ